MGVLGDLNQLRVAGPEVPKEAPKPPVHWPAPLAIPDDFEVSNDCPQGFICPITQGIMALPASTPTGESFEYDDLCKWIMLKGVHPTNPSKQLSVNELHPNLFLRTEIEKYMARHAASAAERPGGRLGRGGGMGYEGEYNAAGEYEGRGVMRYADGDVYDGEWKAGMKEGRGVYRCANGIVVSGFYKQGADVGEGVMWMADGQQAWRLRDGKPVEWISLEEADR